MFLDQALAGNPEPHRKLPQPLKLAGPTLTNDQVLGLIDDGFIFLARALGRKPITEDTGSTEIISEERDAR